MIVIAIIGILAAIAIPKFAELIRKSTEGKSKGNLGALRSALSIYYSDMEGYFPTDDLVSLTANGKYINSLPNASAPNYHPDSAQVRTNFAGGAMLGCAGGYSIDDGKWGYWSDSIGTCAGATPAGQKSKQWGDLWMACSHTDSKSSVWTTY